MPYNLNDLHRNNIGDYTEYYMSSSVPGFFYTLVFPKSLTNMAILKLDDGL